MMNKLKNFFVEEVEEEQEKRKERHSPVTPLKSPIERNEIESLEHSNLEVERNFKHSPHFNPSELEEVTRSVLIEEEVESDFLDENTKEYEIIKDNNEKEIKETKEAFKFPFEVEDQLEVKEEPVVQTKKEHKPVKDHSVDLKVSVSKDMRKFTPSPVISPVYGIVNGGRDEYLDSHRKKEVKLEEKPKHKKNSVSIDSVREKAFGKRPAMKEADPISTDTGELHLDLGEIDEMPIRKTRDQYEEEGILEDIVPVDQEEQVEDDLPFDTEEHVESHPNHDLFSMEEVQEVVLDGDTAELNLQGLDESSINNDDSFFGHLFTDEELSEEEEVFKVSDLTLEEAEESYGDFGMEYDVNQEQKEKRFSESNPLENHLENAGSAKELKEQMSLFYKMVNDEIEKGE